MSDDSFYVVAATSEVPEGGQLYVELNGEEILICHHDSNYYAIAYFCSHAEFTLEGGYLRNGCITCPYHGAEFALEDGSVQAPPAFEPIKTYPLELIDGLIKVSSQPK